MSNKKYTKKQIIEIGSKYNSKKEFELNDTSVYWSAYEYGVMDEISSIMKDRENKKITKDIHNIALKFKTKKEFRSAHPDKYAKAHKLGVLKEILSHTNVLKKSWTFDQLKKEAFKYKTKKEFLEKNNSAYSTAYKRGLIEKICGHMEKTSNHWNEDLLKKEALKFSNRGDFSKNSSAYQAAWEKGVLDQICSHMKSKLTYWSDEELKLEALKYKTKKEFLEKNNSAYTVAHKRNLISKICSHMPKSILIGGTPPNFKWSKQEIQKEALKYLSLEEFKKSNLTAYKKAVKFGLISTVCSHMEIPISGSLHEFNLLNIIKKDYPKAQKIKFSKINISDKPHIRAFEIDIYVPELRKGIEFDGTFHHSFNGLKRGRPNWPDNDLLQYHELKDSWFKSKNIELLHIKEEDWNKNRELCIQKCFDFFRGQKC